MGYTTKFYGDFSISPEISAKHHDYINEFNRTRRMIRDNICENYPDIYRTNVELPIGPDDCYFVGGKEDFGQAKDDSIIDYNKEPSGQPGLWCQWKIVGNRLKWDGIEKFYHYVEWLEYLIEHFFKHWGYTLNGEVLWEGEWREDMGKIIVKDNVVEIKKAKISY